MKLLSWNVNGIRAVMNKGLPEFIENAGGDVYCFQETKAAAGQVESLLFPPAGFHAYWNAPTEKKGYSGTLVLTRQEPLSVSYGMDIMEHDTEGRVINCEFPDYWVVTVYTPNSQDGLRRLDYRCGQWDVCFLKHLKRLEQTKPVVVCGDFNVAHKEIDLSRPKENVNSPGFTPQERAGMDNYVAAGFLDTFREFHPDVPEQYTWWSQRTRARERNKGWRLDYFLISQSLRPRLKDAFILQDVMGSDHCPVGVVIE